MSEAKISILLPMYNAEDTIEECMDSIVGQTIFDKMEILVVDDASSDAGIEKVSAYEKLFPEQIAIICLDSNHGPGHARNVAMEYASGEFIGFVDADDAIVPTMYEHLYEEALRTGADLVDGGYYDQNNDTAIIYTSDDLVGELDAYKRSKLIVSGGYNVTKLFRRDFLMESGICFRNVYVLEDMDYLIEVFAKAKSISNVKEIMYIYRNSSNSLSKTMETGKYIRSTSSAMEAIFEKTSHIPYYDEIREACEYAMLQLYAFSVNKALYAYASKEKDFEWLQDAFSELRELKNRIIRGDYTNRFVKEKIKKSDIELMKLNDIPDDSDREKTVEKMLSLVC